MKTAKLNLNLLQSNQANKEVLVNENMNLLDKLIHPLIKSKDTISPPPSPNYGDIYIIPEGSQWPAESNDLALYIDEWIYIAPKAGMIAWLEDKLILSFYNGEVWLPLTQTSTVLTPVV